MLTKSLHTVTAATNVAMLLRRTSSQRYAKADGGTVLAMDALRVLNQHAAVDGSEPHYQQIVRNCIKLLADVAKAAA